MAALALDGQLGRTLTIDQCSTCQALWFDQHESLQLAPASTLKLFQLIGQQTTAPRPRGEVLKCPRCGLRLVPTHDQQHNTPFQYFRCGREHGRFIGYVDFLREKNFIRPLSAQQLTELRQNVRTINCSNCGAPVDLVHALSCSHCGSPLSMLDMAQVGRVVSQLQQADRRDKPIDPSLPLDLERARQEVENTFAAFSTESKYWADATTFGLVGAGLNAVARWLRDT